MEHGRNEAMPFEVFSRRAVSRVKEPTITIQRRGTISLNAATAALITGLEDLEAMQEVPLELLYDREEKLVGIRRAKAETMTTYKMRKQKNADSFLLAGKMFTTFYGIDTGDSKKYRARDLGDGIIGFGLSDDNVTVSREAGS
jgi:hypothetical protein